MRDLKVGGPTDTVNVAVFCSRPDLAILDAFIKPLQGVTTNEEAIVYNSTGPDGGYFSYLRVIGKAKDVAKALSSFLASKKDEFEMECGPETFKVKIKASQADIEKLLEKAAQFDLRQIVPPSDVQSIGQDPGVIEGFAAKRPLPPESSEPKPN